MKNTYQNDLFNGQADIYHKKILEVYLKIT